MVSIFVNPAQFDNAEDLDRYPRAFEKDIELLRPLSERIMVFNPSVEEMYAPGYALKEYDLDGLDRSMEGAHRPGHFTGVANIVELFFRIVAPQRAYFGEKDFQQLQIVRKLVDKCALPVSIVACPIVREPNGLALSSRNERLPQEVRSRAGFIYDTLMGAKAMFGTKSADYLVEWAQERFRGHPLFRLQYFEIAEEETLVPIQKKGETKKYRAFIAVYAHEVRLIDNIALN